MLYQLPVLSNQQLQPIAIVQQGKQDPKPIEYTIQAEDTLTSIAESHGETAQRLFDKNLNISSPDVIIPGQKLNIPLKDEKLDDRPFPVTIEADGHPRPSTGTAVTGGSSSSGNFQWGWCTYLADQLRPDIHATGNAADWIRYANSKVPAINAVAVNTKGLGHVAVVIGIDGNRTLVRHMNWRGFGVISEDWVDGSYWSGYIL